MNMINSYWSWKHWYIKNEDQAFSFVVFIAKDRCSLYEKKNVWKLVFVSVGMVNC